MLTPTVTRIRREPLTDWAKRVGWKTMLKRYASYLWKDALGTLGINISASPNVTPSFDGINETERLTFIYGSITPSGNYPAAGGGGDTLSYAGFDFIKSDYPPLRVYILEQPAAGATPSGYAYVFCPGTTQANGKMVLMYGGGANAPDVEVTGNPTYASKNLSPLVYEAVFARV